MELIIIEDDPTGAVYTCVGGFRVHVPDEEAFVEQRFDWSRVRRVPRNHRLARLPELSVRVA